MKERQRQKETQKEMGGRTNTHAKKEKWTGEQVGRKGDRKSAGNQSGVYIRQCPFHH